MVTLVLVSCGTAVTEEEEEVTPPIEEEEIVVEEEEEVAIVEPETQGVTTYFDDDYFYIVGEITNTTSFNLSFVEIIATYYDQEEIVIGTTFTFTELDILLPDQTSPFEISSYPDTIQPASYKLDIDYHTTDEQPFSGLHIKSSSDSIDNLGFFKIVGEVENTSSSSAQFVQIIVTYYDAQNNVIGTDFTFTQVTIVQSGTTASFELSSYPRQLRPASYKLQVQGN